MPKQQARLLQSPSTSRRTTQLVKPAQAEALQQLFTLGQTQRRQGSSRARPVSPGPSPRKR